MKTLPSLLIISSDRENFCFIPQ